MRSVVSVFTVGLIAVLCGGSVSLPTVSLPLSTGPPAKTCLKKGQVAGRNGLTDVRTKTVRALCFYTLRCPHTCHEIVLCLFVFAIHGAVIQFSRW